MKRLALLLASLALVACSSNETSPGAGSDAGSSSSSSGSSSSSSSSSGSITTQPDGSTGQEDAYCAARKSHATCNDGSTLSCDGDNMCLYGRLMTTAAAAAYNACYSAPSCKSDDECVVEAGKASGGAAATAYANDCPAKLSGCTISGNGELCTAAVYAYRNVGEAFAVCLSKPCNEIEACFDAALKPVTDCEK